MKYKYEAFKDYFEEIENYCLRLERFHEEFSAVPEERRQRMIEWLESAFDCGREKKNND
jgi:predicted transcriptional regulator